MKNRRGFSLTELVITIIIIAILAIVSVVTYRGYRQRAIDTEARMMLGKLNEAQQIYYTRNKQYLGGLSNVSQNNSLGVDFRRNKYFSTFTVESVD